MSLVTFNDILVLGDRLATAGRGRLLSRVLRSRNGRVRAAWEKTERPPSSWKEIPAVRRRCNCLISGDPAVGIPTFIADRFLRPAGATRLVSLGCGTGALEIELAGRLPGASLVGFDLSPARIAAARQAATAAGLGHRVEFRQGDASRIALGAHSLDAVLVHDSLHHFSPLRDLLTRVHDALLPGGIFIADEFVGPARFQWSDRQLVEVNAMIASLPARFRTTARNTIKRFAHRPGRLTMLLSDPSEAVESDSIPTLLREKFEIVQWTEYGGTILHLALKDLAHHFLEPDEEGERVLQACFQREDVLLQAGALPSDFLFAVCRVPADDRRRAR